jgi:tetratricopeptide (TPR) repeat protein
VLKSPLHQLSPILTDAANAASFLLSDKGVANKLTAIFLYASNHCDLAAPYVTATTAVDDPLAFYAGNCALEKGDFHQAIEAYSHSLRGSDGDIHYATAINMAWAYVKLDQGDQAFSLLGDSIKNHEVSGYTGLEELFVSRAQLYALAFRYDDAVVDMDEALKLDPNNPALYVLRAEMNLLLYEWDKVLADYNKAIELDPTYADAYFYRGMLFYSRDLFQQALPDFERYLDLAPQGDHAAEANQYADQVRTTLQALDEK